MENIVFSSAIVAQYLHFRFFFSFPVPIPDLCIAIHSFLYQKQEDSKYNGLT